jgi:hypothetical protein
VAGFITTAWGAFIVDSRALDFVDKNGFTGAGFAEVAALLVVDLDIVCA